MWPAWQIIMRRQETFQLPLKMGLNCYSRLPPHFCCSQSWRCSTQYTTQVDTFAPSGFGAGACTTSAAPQDGAVNHPGDMTCGNSPFIPSYTPTMVLVRGLSTAVYSSFAHCLHPGVLPSWLRSFLILYMLLQQNTGA